MRYEYSGVDGFLMKPFEEESIAGAFQLCNRKDDTINTFEVNGNEIVKKILYDVTPKRGSFPALKCSRPFRKPLKKNYLFIEGIVAGILKKHKEET